MGASADENSGYKWWLGSVIVPLLSVGIAGGVALWIKNSGIHSSGVSDTVVQSLAAMAEIDAAKRARKDGVARLLEKGPPHCYRLSENCDFTWANYQGRRLSVRDAGGLQDPCPVEEWGFAVPEDPDHYYSGGRILMATSKERDLGDRDCYPPLEVTLAASSTVSKADEVVTFSVYADGGNDYYTVEWSGDDGLHSYDLDVNMTYGTPGLKAVRVQVNSNGESVFKTAKILIKKG